MRCSNLDYEIPLSHNSFLRAKFLSCTETPLSEPSNDNSALCISGVTSFDISHSTPTVLLGSDRKSKADNKRFGKMSGDGCCVSPSC